MPSGRNSGGTWGASKHRVPHPVVAQPCQAPPKGCRLPMWLCLSEPAPFPFPLPPCAAASEGFCQGRRQQAWPWSWVELHGSCAGFLSPSDSVLSLKQDQTSLFRFSFRNRRDWGINPEPLDAELLKLLLWEKKTFTYIYVRLQGLRGTFGRLSVSYS